MDEASNTPSTLSSEGATQMPSPSSKSGSMKKIVTILIIVLVLIAVIVGAFAFYRNTRPGGGKPFFGLGAKKTDLGTPNTDLPISLKNKGVKSARINYLFQADITEIKKTADDLTEIVTSLDSLNKPQFILDTETPVFIREGTTEQAASASALTIGQNVDISISFRLKEKTWNNVSRVTINESGGLPQRQ